LVSHVAHIGREGGNIVVYCCLNHFLSCHDRR
jgi:hypothetical protein